MEQNIIDNLVVDYNQYSNNKQGLDQDNDLIEQLLICRRLESMQYTTQSFVQTLDLYWQHNDYLIFELETDVIRNNQYIDFVIDIDEQQLHQNYTTNHFKKEKYNKIFFLQEQIESFISDMKYLIDDNPFCYRINNGDQQSLFVSEFIKKKKQNNESRIICFKEYYNSEFHINGNQIKQFFKELQDYINPMYNQIKERKKLRQGSMLLVYPNKQKTNKRKRNSKIFLL